MPRFGAEDGGMEAQDRGESMHPAQQARLDEWRARRTALREAMDKDARARARGWLGPRRSVADIQAEARRNAQAVYRRQKLEQARLDEERRRRREAQQARNTRLWQQINDAPVAPQFGQVSGPTPATGENFISGFLGGLTDKPEPANPNLPPLGLPEVGKSYKVDKPKPEKAKGNGFQELFNQITDPKEKGLENDLSAGLGTKPDEKELPEAIRRYRDLLSQWTQQTRTRIDGPAMGPGQDGTLFGGLVATDQGGLGLAFPNLSGQGLPYYLTKDTAGNWVMEDATTAFRSFVPQTLNPDTAGVLAYQLNAAGYYGVEAAKRLEERLTPYEKPDGTAAFRIQWGEDDWDALETALQRAGMEQATRAEAGNYVDYKDIIEQRAMAGKNLAEAGVGAEPGEGPEINDIGLLPAGEYGGVNLSKEQLMNANTIAAVGFEMGASPRDVMIGIMTAMQESQLKNVNYGDRDSLGLFQQRPSQGWGTPEQVQTPQYAARKFFEGLLGVSNREAMAPTEAAQTVQRSAFPDAYAKWEQMAQAVLGTAQSASGGTPDMSSASAGSTLPNFTGAALPQLNADGTSSPGAPITSVSSSNPYTGGTSSSSGGSGGFRYQGTGFVSDPGPVLTDQETVKLLASAIGAEQLGRELTEQEVAQITELVHQQERNDWSAQMAGGTARMSPNPQAIIEAWIEDNLGGEETGYQEAELMLAFMNMVAGGGFGGM